MFIWYDNKSTPGMKRGAYSITSGEFEGAGVFEFLQIVLFRVLRDLLRSFAISHNSAYLATIDNSLPYLSNKMDVTKKEPRDFPLKPIEALKLHLMNSSYYHGKRTYTETKNMLKKDGDYFVQVGKYGTIFTIPR